MSKNGKQAKLNTIIFFLAVACLWRYKTDMDEKAKQQPPVAPIVATNNVQNTYNEIYDRIMTIPEEPQQNEFDKYGWQQEYPLYEDDKNKLWKYQMPKKELWEWERDFLDNWRR